MKIKGAIFDMDGTLINSLTFWNYYWPIFGKDFLNDDNFIVPYEVNLLMRTTILKLAGKSLKDAFSLSNSEEEIKKHIKANIDWYYDNKVGLKDGVVEFLDYLKSQNIKMCIASASTYDDIIKCVKKFGIYDYFDFIVSSADLGVGKDKPDVYYLACEKLGLQSNQVCVFEDSFVAIETAKGIGCNTVGIYDENNFDPQRLAKSSDFFVGNEMGMDSLIGKITKE